jgi:hypothetical protein
MSARGSRLRVPPPETGTTGPGPLALPRCPNAPLLGALRGRGACWGTEGAGCAIADGSTSLTGRAVDGADTDPVGALASLGARTVSEDGADDVVAAAKATETRMAAKIRAARRQRPPGMRCRAGELSSRLPLSPTLRARRAARITRRIASLVNPTPPPVWVSHPRRSSRGRLRATLTVHVRVAPSHYRTPGTSSSVRWSSQAARDSQLGECSSDAEPSATREG